ncbi:MAG: hypothetical protein NTZ33_06330 [Bacteroidetes bacterium]|nr:hypothetical protein [Bacteroidota bacterium]
MKSSNKYFIRTKGKNEFKTYHLINIDNFDMLDIFFDSEEKAIEYAKKKQIEIETYTEIIENE